MGTVYLGLDERLERVVAVKVLRPDRRMDADAGQRFLREARLLSRLNHPGICQVYDLVEDDDDQFLILEFVEGVSLKEVAEDDPDETRILRIVMETAEALAAAHREQIIHRDLKPENVMLTPDGHVKILDFGIARLAGPADRFPSPDPVEIVPGIDGPDDRSDDWSESTQDWTVVSSFPGDDDASRSCTLHTRRGTIVGTPAFMAPEQVLGLVPTTACDVYSLGIIFRRLLTGSSPYGEGLTTMALLLRVSEAETEPLEDIDSDIADLASEMTAPAPEDRPSAARCAERLQWILTRPERRRRRRVMAALSIVAGAALLVAAGVALTHQWRVRHQARLARQFAEKASSIEWLMRAEHLAPPHDLTDAKRRVRATIAELQARVAELDGQDAAPGHAAIGRAWATLGDNEQALVSLERARDLGLRTPELACSLGLSLGKRFNTALTETQRIADEGQRASAVERARRDYRDPAVACLSECRGAIDMPSGYVDALIALYEGRLDDCRKLIDGISEIPAWFYAVDELKSLLANARANHEGRTNLDQKIARLETALPPLERALETGRSDPSLYARRCAIKADILYVSLSAQNHTVSPEAFEDALEDCRQVAAIDPTVAEGPAEIVEILTLAAQERQQRGQDPTEDYRRARTRADAVVAAFPKSKDAFWARGTLCRVEAWFNVSRGRDATALVEQCIDDARSVSRLDPTFLSQEGNQIANCAYIGAVQAFWAGRDPSRWVETGMHSLQPILDDPSGYVFPHTTAANLSFLQALWEREHGRDPRGSFDRAIENYRVVARNDPSPNAFANLANALIEKARSLLEAGEDPGPSLDRAEPEIRRAIEANPRVDMPYFLLGNLFRLRAEVGLLHGRDPAPLFRESYDAFAQGVKANKGNMEGYTEAAETRLVEAEYLIDRGEDPRRTIAAARSLAGQTLDLNPSFSRAHRAVARSFLLEARWEARSGRSPLETLEKAETALGETLTSKLREADSFGLLSEIQLARARWKKDNTLDFRLDADAATTAAETALEINPRLSAARRTLSELRSLEE